MLKSRLACAVLGALLITGCAPTHHLNTANARPIAQQLADARRMMVGNDSAHGEAALRDIAASKEFNSLPGEDQHRVLASLAQAANRQGQLQLAYQYLARVTAMPEASFGDGVALVNTASKLRHRADTATALTALVRRWPDKISELDDHFTVQFLAEAHRVPRGTMFPLLQALYDAHWKLKWGIEPSTAWCDFALLLLEQGRLPEAVEVSSHVTNTYVLVAMRADRRFDAVVAANPSLFDIAAAADRELRGLQALSENTPHSLELQSHTIEALGNQLHYGAMLAASDSVISEVTSTNFPDKLYEDYDEQYQWILSDRAAALERVARWDEAVEVSITASHLIGADASQPLDLGALYCDLGRPNDAISALRLIVDEPNAYGAMQIELVRLDAAMQLKDSNQVARSLQFIVAHRTDSLSAYESALVLVNQPDKAAALLVTRLLDPADRLDALESIQTYVDPPAMPHRGELNARWRAVIDRRDVRLAANKVGRIESYRLEPPDIFD